MKFGGDPTGETLFLHVGALGTTGIVTNEVNSASQDRVYYPLGQQWAPLNGGYDIRFGSLQERDRVTGFDPTPARQYTSTLGRWMSPDPLAGDISNPQSLNRYAYALNNPTTLTDPRGLSASMPYHLPPCYGMVCADQYYGGSMYPGFTSADQTTCTQDGVSAKCGDINWETVVQCPANDCGIVSMSNSKGQVAFGEFHPTQTNPYNYQQLTSWIADASLPQNAAYSLFSKAANQQNLDPSKAYTVSAYYQGLELNINVVGQALNTSLLPPTSVEDPFTFVHNGDASFFQLWPPVDSSHYIADPSGFGFHQDVFGVLLLPLHELDYALGAISGPSTTMSFQCQIGVGCH